MSLKVRLAAINLSKKKVIKEQLENSGWEELLSSSNAFDYKNKKYAKEESFEKKLTSLKNDYDNSFIYKLSDPYGFDAKHTFNKEDKKKLKKRIKKSLKKSLRKKNNPLIKNLIVFADSLKECFCCIENLKKNINNSKKENTLEKFIPKITNPQIAQSLLPRGNPSRYTMEWKDIVYCDNINPCKSYEIEIWLVDVNKSKERCVFRENIPITKGLDDFDENFTLLTLDNKVNFNVSENYIINYLSQNMPELRVDFSHFFTRNFCLRIRCSNDDYIDSSNEEIWSQCTWFSFQCAH